VTEAGDIVLFPEDFECACAHTQFLLFKLDYVGVILKWSEFHKIELHEIRHSYYYKKDKEII
jgi:hypothetical protein